MMRLAWSPTNLLSFTALLTYRVFRCDECGKSLRGAREVETAT